MVLDGQHFCCHNIHLQAHHLAATLQEYCEKWMPLSLQSCGILRNSTTNEDYADGKVASGMRDDVARVMINKYWSTYHIPHTRPVINCSLAEGVLKKKHLENMDAKHMFLLQM
jgi:hypothetical protein